MGSGQSTSRDNIVPGNKTVPVPEGPSVPVPAPVPTPGPAPVPEPVSSAVNGLPDDRAENMMVSWARDVTTFLRLLTLKKVGGDVPEFVEETKMYDADALLDSLKRTVGDDFYSKANYLVGITHAYTDLDPVEAARLSDIFARSEAYLLGAEELKIRNTVTLIYALHEAFGDQVEIVDQMLEAAAGDAPDQDAVDLMIQDFYNINQSIGQSLDAVVPERDGFYEKSFFEHANQALTQIAVTRQRKVDASTKAGEADKQVFEEIAKALAADLDDYLIDPLQKL